MPSSRSKPTLRRQVFLALTNKVESQLRDLYAKKDQAGYSQSQAADRIGIHRSAITRRLNGRSNMTLETVADMVWAGGGCIDVHIFDPEEVASSNMPKPPHEPVLLDAVNNQSVTVQTGIRTWTPEQGLVDA